MTNQMRINTCVPTTQISTIGTLKDTFMLLANSFSMFSLTRNNYYLVFIYSLISMICQETIFLI